MKSFDKEKEKKKLTEIFKSLPENRKKIAEGLIEDAGFMVEELAKLREIIAREGWREEYQNGAQQHGYKTSVAAESYLKLQKSYTAVIHLLNDMLPSLTDESSTKAGENLAKFIIAGKPVKENRK